MYFRKHYLVLIFLSVLCLLACQDTTGQTVAKNTDPIKKTGTFFQYNIWAAFVNKIFDGDLTVKNLKAKGDIGLGSFDMLDGELVMLNGVAYRVREDGSISEGKPADEVAYADACFFHSDRGFSVNKPMNYDTLRKELSRQMPSANHFYAFRIHGIFDSLKLGGVPKQSPPFDKGLDVLIPARPIFTGTKVAGTMIGFYCPQFIGDINTAAYHFHFISDDKKLGGHVMELTVTSSLQVSLQKLTSYEFMMPSSPAFDTVQFDKQFQYNKK